MRLTVNGRCQLERKLFPFSHLFKQVAETISQLIFREQAFHLIILYCVNRLDLNVGTLPATKLHSCHLLSKLTESSMVDVEGFKTHAQHRVHGE